MNLKKHIKKFKAILAEAKATPSKGLFDGKIVFYYVTPETMAKLEWAIRSFEVDEVLQKNSKR